MSQDTTNAIDWLEEMALLNNPGARDRILRLAREVRTAIARLESSQNIRDARFASGQTYEHASAINERRKRPYSTPRLEQLGNCPDCTHCAKFHPRDPIAKDHGCTVRGCSCVGKAYA